MRACPTSSVCTDIDMCCKSEKMSMGHYILILQGT